MEPRQSQPGRCARLGSRVTIRRRPSGSPSVIWGKPGKSGARRPSAHDSWPNGGPNVRAASALQREVPPAAGTRMSPSAGHCRRSSPSVVLVGTAFQAGGCGEGAGRMRNAERRASRPSMAPPRPVTLARTADLLPASRFFWRARSDTSPSTAQLAPHVSGGPPPSQPCTQRPPRCGEGGRSSASIACRPRRQRAGTRRAARSLPGSCEPIRVGRRALLRAPVRTPPGLREDASGGCGR